MQIDRSPSRGPYVAVLVCLFILCLIVPVYWQSGERAPEREEPLGFDRGASDIARIDYYRSVLFGHRNGLVGYAPEESLDELLRDLANRQAQTIHDDAFTQLLTVPGESVAVHNKLATMPAFVTDVFRHAGRQMARRPSVDISPIVARLVETTTTPITPLRNPRMMLGSYDDGWTMAPANSPQAFAVEAFESPWCSPTMLLERLEVLTHHPYTNHWAWETIGQLQPLTENRQLRSEEVAARLLRLQTLAAEARELADATNDETLRAELLRAHWGLSRRIACWGLMRDIVVASAAANRFATRLPWEPLPNALAGQGAAPADLQSLSGDLEHYEHTRSPKLARAIVERQRLLAASADLRQRELADQLEQNYRNANVRFAISAAMMERFVEQPEPQFSPVRDRIAGTPVRGRSETFAENNVQLRPDEARWNLGLESQGMVQSNTVADGGQAKVRSRSTTQFTAEKNIVVDPHGVRMGIASADAQTCSRLVGIETSFDWLPVVDQMVRDRALEEYGRKRMRAAAEVEYKVARRVESQLDERADQAVERMEHQLRDRVTGPLEHAGVTWMPIQLSTTEDRVVARLRVAGDDQLAGHTPRPRAPADSVASLQLHESALTNAARSLQLDGRRFTTPELQTFLREKFSRSSQPEMNVESDTEFEFAEADAVRVRMADERLEVILSLAEVNYERDPVRNFRVHAFYRPLIQGVEAELVRDGALGIEGRLRTGERARMHGVFNKVLSDDRRLPILRLSNPSDPRLAGLMITQLVLEDGWMGLSLGPEAPNRTAERSRMLR